MMQNPVRFDLAAAAAVLILIVESLIVPVNLNALEIGETAPGFNLPGVDGRNYSLEDFADSPVLVVVFTANHCPTAQAYEGRIMNLAADFSQRGVALVAISPNDPEAVRLDELGYSDMGDSFEDMKIRARHRGFEFPYLYDGENQKVSRAYGPVATPHVFVFDTDRKLRYTGRIDDSEKIERVSSRDARNAIEALLAGRPVTLEKTKSFGCSIKWSDKRSGVAQAFERWAAEEVTVEMVDEAGVRSLIANHSDRLRLVNLWATWCGPCVVEFPELVAINRMYRNRDFEMITISADSPGKKEQVLSFLKRNQASCTNFLFNSENKYQLIEAVDKEWPGSIPYTLLIAPGGEIIYRNLGMIEPLELKMAIVGHLGRYYE
jgi:peroxiredoxin